MHLRTDTKKGNISSMVPSLSGSARNAFPMYEKNVTTIQFDGLYPIFHDWIYPGDTIAGDMYAMARLQTQLTYLMDDLYLDWHWWFRPMRLMQTNWSRYQFNYQETPGQDNSALTSPALNMDAGAGASITADGAFKSKSLYDYFKYPTLIDYHGTTPSQQHLNNYLGRAYNQTWDESYRDQNLQLPPQIDKGDGPDNPNHYIIRKRGKRFDWTTSGFVDPQKGDPSAAPVLGGGPVVRDGTAPQFRDAAGDHTIYGDGSNQALFGNPTPTTGASMTWGGNTGLEYTLTNGLAYMLVNDLRMSVAVQHFYEADNYGGTRDVESIKHRWGVTVPDFRMNRSEYLGGATFTFDGHVVPQTSATVEGSTPQANLTSFSQTMMKIPLNHSFVEHGILMLLCSARSNMTYQQGLERDVTYKTRLDWYQPEFSHVGNVALLNREVEATGVDANDMLAFNYNDYAYWLRYSRNFVTAEMRSNYPQSLDSRHMAYEFTSTSFNSAFIASFTPIDRNIVVQTSVADPIELNTIFKGRIVRKLPVYSVPGLNRL